MTDSLNRQRFVTLAEAIYGPKWQNAASRDLGVSQPQCWRWAHGEQEPSDKWLYELESIAQRKFKQIGQALRAGKPAQE